MSRRTYAFTYAALMVLLLITWGSTFVPLGPIKPVVNIGIGMTKAAIIILFFMHLVKAEPLTKLAGAVAWLWLVLMFALGFSDYLAR